MIPGVTTVQRVWGARPAASQPKTEPLDLDLYVDSSGSMPDPQRRRRYLALAGAIVALSALRARRARVQATLWSGPDEFETTSGFVRDEAKILRILTGSFRGSTAFPMHVLRDTYRHRPMGQRPAHVLVISDDGVTTMFQNLDEQGTPGWDVCRAALASAGGGGTLVLNLWGGIDETLQKAQREGWAVHQVTAWEDLVAFARAFSRTTYVEPAGG